MARKKDEGGAGSTGRLSPVDVQQAQFRRALRGYDEQEVDDFLDRVTEELALLVEERRAATERAGSLPTVRVANAGDAAAASKQAEDLVRQARERADAIVSEANQRAAAIVREGESRAAAGGAVAAGVAAGAGSGAAIGAFVAKERDFLQRLASLVQGHAEGVKGMLASTRESGAAAPGGAAGSGAAAGTGAAASAARTDAPGGAGSGGSASGPGPAGAGSGGPGTGDAPAAGGSGPTEGPAASGGPAGGLSAAGAGSAAAGERPDAGDPASTAVATQTRQMPIVSGPPEATSTRQMPAVRADPALPRQTPAAQAPGAPGAAANPDDSSLRELFWGEE